MTYYDKDSNELFTGKASWMLRYNNQKFEGSYKNGLLHGKSKIWHQNGNLAQETIYEKGAIISKVSWDENGIKFKETQLINRDLNFSEELWKYCRTIHASSITI